MGTWFSFFVLNIVGYVVAVGANRKLLSSPNEYFDMQIQTSETDFAEVRVMVVANSSISNIFFREKKNAGQAIKVRNAIYSPSGMIFFKQSHKS